MIHGEIGLLGCDVVLVPTDALIRVEETWAGVVTEEEASSGAPEGWHGGAGSRSFVLEPREEAGPRRILLEVATEGSEPVEWYVDGVAEALKGAAAFRDTAADRCRPLVALPLVGTGLGGSAGRRGALIPPLLDALEDAARGHDLDIALVTYHRSDYAAVQAVRAPRGALPEPYEEHAARLAALAARGELVPFIGAGVSAAAGLPAWWDLLERVADIGRVGESGGTGRPSQSMRQSLHELGTLDAAELLRTVLGRDAVDAVIRELDGNRHSLAHGLIASLRAPRAVTTNYDRLYELATSRPLADRGGLAVLPWDAADLERPWLVKMHGDVGHPDSIVLSRGDLVAYDLTRRPLASLFQAQMLTGHLLFVGSSMTDDAVVRLAWEIRELFRAWGAKVRVVGTVLGLREDPLRARLWRDVLSFLPLGRLVEAAEEAPEEAPAVHPDEADEGEHRRGRRDALPVFLDRLAQLASTERSFLLDPRYEDLVAERLQPLRGALLELASAVEQAPAEADPTVVERVQAQLRAFGWGVERP